MSLGFSYFLYAGAIQYGFSEASLAWRRMASLGLLSSVLSRAMFFTMNDDRVPPCAATRPPRPVGTHGGWHDDTKPRSIPIISFSEGVKGLVPQQSTPNLARAPPLEFHENHPVGVCQILLTDGLTHSENIAYLAQVGANHQGDLFFFPLRKNKKTLTGWCSSILGD